MLHARARRQSSLDPGTRALTLLLAGGTILFGAVPIVSPRTFARQFGLNAAEDPTVATAIRSVGVRDVAIGAGLWAAVAQGQASTPWLAARLASDAGDALAVGWGMRAGARAPRFAALGGLALGAALTGALLLARVRAEESEG